MVENVEPRHWISLVTLQLVRMYSNTSHGEESNQGNILFDHFLKISQLNIYLTVYHELLFNNYCSTPKLSHAFLYPKHELLLQTHSSSK